MGGDYVPRCERCGRIDATLRVSEFMAVTSVVLFTYRSYRRGVWCDDCRQVTGRNTQLRTMLAGWWGFPFGLVFTPYALARNTGGGRKPADLNAAVLRAVGAHLVGDGNVREAVRAFDAAQALQFDPNVADFLDQIYGALPSGSAGSALHLSVPHAGTFRAVGLSSRPFESPPQPASGALPRSRSGTKGRVPIVVAVLALFGLVTFAARGLGGNESVKPTPTPYRVPTAAPGEVAIAAKPTPTPYRVPTTTPSAYDEIMASGRVISGQGSQTSFYENSQQRGGPIRLTNETGEEGWYYPDVPADPFAFTWRASIAAISGDGEACLSLANSDQSVWWFYNVDVQRSTWSVDRTNETGQTFEWVVPKRLPASVGAAREIAVKVVDGSPTLLVNGTDVTGPLGIQLPTLVGRQLVGVCANASRTGGRALEVAFDEVELTN